MLHAVIEGGGTHFCSLDEPDIPPIERTLLIALGKHCCVSVPIVAAGETWGQIWASRTRDRPAFGERDARVLRAISAQIAGAISRAEMFAHVSGLARTDGLTGLSNRRAFDEGLEHAHLAARAEGDDLALAMFDLDNLKEINDHKGHAAGDAAIRAAGEVLAAEAAESEGALVARVGGDEFCVLLPGQGEREASALAHRVVRRLSESHESLGVSCGVAVLSEGRGRPTDLLRAADAAQYAAKRAGRGRVFASGLATDDSAAALLHDDARNHRRALRGPAGADVGRLLTEMIAELDGPLANSEPADRLAAVLRRCGEAVDVARSGVAFARTGARPRVVAVAARPGVLRGQLRRSTFLRWADVEGLRRTHALTAGAAPVLIGADDPGLEAGLRGRLRKKGVRQVLVASISGAWGDWIIELVADEFSHPLQQVEPVLRLLAPEALRTERSARAPLGLVAD